MHHADSNMIYSSLLLERDSVLWAFGKIILLQGPCGGEWIVYMNSYPSIEGCCYTFPYYLGDPSIIKHTEGSTSKAFSIHAFSFFSLLNRAWPRYYYRIGQVVAVLSLLARVYDASNLLRIWMWMLQQRHHHCCIYIAIIYYYCALSRLL